MSPSSYPASLDSTATTFPVRSPSSDTAGAHAADHVNLADAIIKIETALGALPAGSYVSLKARVEGLSRIDLLASRGSAAAYSGGRFFATDQLAEYVSNGTDWIRTSAAAGETVLFGGLNLPVNLVRQTGLTISRTGIYADLFESQTRKFAGATGNSGQSVLTVAVGEGFGVGMKVEGTGVPSNATIIALTSTTITLSANLTTTGGREIRIFPYGNGNGSSTFTLPDAKGRTFAGRDNMGNSQTGDASRRIGSVLGATGGAATHVLSAVEMPAHNHTVEGFNGGTGAAGQSSIQFVGNAAQWTLSTYASGGNVAHNNMQPHMLADMCLRL